MKYLPLKLAAVLLMGCGELRRSTSSSETQLNEVVKKDAKTDPKIDKAISCCNSIHEAAANGIIEGVKAHLAAGTDVNEKDNDGLTPLHLAKTKEIAELLIAEGANLNSIDNFFDFTPLDFMEGEVDQEIINLLRKHGAKKAEELQAEGN